MSLARVDFQLPWSQASEQERRFRRILSTTLAVFLLACLVVPMLPVTEITREEQEQLPPQLARVILEKQALPEPVKPPAPKPEPKPKPKPKPEPKKVPPVVTEKPEPKPEQRLNTAREQAETAMLEFQDELEAMRDSVDVDNITSANLSRGQSTATELERSMITAKASASAGTIKTANLSRDVGGAALSGRQTTQVASPVQSSQARSKKTGSSERGGRNDDAIRKVMDANKGAIFAIYNRALRKDPALQGKVVFEMVIEPSGQISKLTLLSSELADADLTDKILARVRLVRFPAEAVTTTRVNYSFDFLPY